MRLFKFGLPVLFAAGLALFAAHAFNEQADRASRALLLEHARNQFAQRLAVSRAAADEARWRDELRAALRDWFAGQDEIGNRFPDLRGQPGPFLPPPPRARGGDLSEWQKLAEARVGAWREGRVELMQTAYAQGLRLDLLQVTRAGAGLAVDVAVWGAPEESDTEEVQAGKAVQRVTVPVTFKGLSMRFFDGAGKLVARMDGGGEPALRLDVPARLVADAPPGVILARYEPGAFPPGAAEVEWTLAVQLKSLAGETRVAQGTWKMPVNPAWADAAWSGEKLVTEEAPAAPAPAPMREHAAAWPIR